VFGRYVLFDRIGRGGMADIFLARADTSLGGSRLCVLKQILPELGRDVQFERMLVEEAKLAARLTHANVVQVFDLGREGDRLFIGMEYVEGFDLNQLLRALSQAKVALPGEFALFVVREVLRGLDYAHRTKDGEGRLLGLVHRDVSPSNVLISFEGEVKLCDFGIARALSAHDDASPAFAMAATRVVGKSAYMAPEHARGEPIDARADVFAAAIVLWELCAGRRLYKGTEDEMLALAKQAKVPPLPERGLPEQAKLQAVLDRALARYRDERYQSAQEFLRGLEDYAIGAKLMASQLRFGAFLTEHFGKQIVELRRERERAALAFASEIPPAPKPGEEDEAPTTVADASAMFEHAEKDVESATSKSRSERNPRVWSEPGAIDGPERPLDSGKVSLREPGGEDTGVNRAVTLSDELDLDRSLMGLQVLADQAQAEQRVHSTPPVLAPQASSNREWLWYAVALAILGLGLVGYLWK
jgi:serine/threonine-protein kinase